MIVTLAISFHINIETILKLCFIVFTEMIAGVGCIHIKTVISDNVKFSHMVRYNTLNVRRIFYVVAFYFARNFKLLHSKPYI